MQGAFAAKKFNGAPLKDAQAKHDCFQIKLREFETRGAVIKSSVYYLDMDIKNVTTQACVIDPYLFRIVDSEGRQFDTQRVDKFGARKKGETVTLLPGASKECTLQMGRLKWTKTQPTAFYFGTALLGHFVKE